MRGQARPPKLHHAPAMRSQHPARSRRTVQICLAAYEKVSELHSVAWAHHSWPRRCLLHKVDRVSAINYCSNPHALDRMDVRLHMQ
jgi:hypothetical protein